MSILGRVGAVSWFTAPHVDKEKGAPILAKYDCASVLGISRATVVVQKMENHAIEITRSGM